MKKTSGIATLLLCCALPGAYAANPFGDAVKKSQEAMKNAAQPAQQASQPQQLQQTPQAQQQTPQQAQLQQLQAAQAAAAANAPCPQQAAAEAKLTIGEQARALGLQMTLAKATKSLSVDEVQLPATIKDVCTAQKRLMYVNRATKRWSSLVIKSIQQANQALDLKLDMQAYAAFNDNEPEFSPTQTQSIVSLQRDMDRDLGKIKAAIDAKHEANNAVLAEARGNLGSAGFQAGLIGAWDKRLVDYISDNRKWALNNMPSVTLFVSHVSLLANTGKSVQSVFGAVPESDEKTHKTVASIMKKQEEQNAKDSKQLEKELQL